MTPPSSFPLYGGYASHERDEYYYFQFMRMQKARTAFYQRLGEATGGEIHGPKSFMDASGFGYMVANGLRHPSAKEYDSCIPDTLRERVPEIEQWLQEFAQTIPLVPRAYAKDTKWSPMAHLAGKYVGATNRYFRDVITQQRDVLIQETMEQKNIGHDRAELLVTRHFMAPFRERGERGKAGLYLHDDIIPWLEKRLDWIATQDAAPPPPEGWKCADHLANEFVATHIAEKLEELRERLIAQYHDPEHPGAAEKYVAEHFVGAYKPNSGHAAVLYASPKAVDMLVAEGKLVHRAQAEAKALPYAPEDTYSASDLINEGRFIGSTVTINKLLSGLREETIEAALADGKSQEAAEAEAANYVFYARHRGGKYDEPTLYTTLAGIQLLVERGDLTYQKDAPPLPPPGWRSAQQIRYEYRGNLESISNRITQLHKRLFREYSEQLGDKDAVSEYIHKHFIGEYKPLRGSSTLYLSPRAVHMLEAEYDLRPLKSLLPPSRHNWRFIRSLDERYDHVKVEQFYQLAEQLIAEMSAHGFSEKDARAHADDHWMSSIKPDTPGKALAVISPEFERMAVMSGILVSKKKFEHNNPLWQEKLAAEEALKQQNAAQKVQ